MSKPNWEAILTAFGNQVQDLEDALYELLTKRSIDSATGVQLDGLGEILGEAREGRDDPAYREALRVRILLNLCESTPEEIIEIMLRASGSSSVEFEEFFPAALTVNIVDPIDPTDSDGDGVPDVARRLYNFLIEAKPAAVLAHLFYIINPIGDVKFFDTAGQGFDSGRWSGAL